MKKIIYSNFRTRYVLLQYQDGRFAVFKTRKPYYDVNDFPSHKVKVSTLTEIPFRKYLYWKIWLRINKDCSAMAN